MEFVCLVTLEYPKVKAHNKKYTISTFALA